MKIIKNTGRKYSEMLSELIQKFDDELPEELTFEDTLEIGIEAWNLANNKEFLESKELYKKELKSYNYSNVIEKMVLYKLEHFPEHNNVIVDYNIENETLTITTQTQENYINSIFSQLVNYNPSKK